MKKVIFVLGLSLLTGCAGITAHTGEHFQLAGTPEGIRAFGDTLVGAMKTAKEKDNARNQYFAHREDYERNVTTRSAQPGFLQKLFSADAPEGSQGS